MFRAIVQQEYDFDLTPYARSVLRHLLRRINGDEFMTFQLLIDRIDVSFERHNKSNKYFSIEIAHISDDVSEILIDNLREEITIKVTDESTHFEVFICDIDKEDE